MNGLPDRTYAVYLGLDVGKSEHHATALHVDGKRLHDKPLAQDETTLRELYAKLAAYGPVLAVVGDASAFPTPGHLAAYAGLAPVTRRSGSSTRGEHPPRGGNKNLERAMFLAAFAALSDPNQPGLLRPQRAQGKRHNAALICLARRRCDVLYAMLRHATPCQHRPPAAA